MVIDERLEEQRSEFPQVQALLDIYGVGLYTALSECLELSGHCVRLAHDGQSALEAVLQFEPEVVLLDIGLPGMDGYAVATRLRQQFSKGLSPRTLPLRARPCLPVRHRGLPGPTLAAVAPAGALPLPT